LQALLEAKVAQGYFESTVEHLRWDMRHIFEYAITNAGLKMNPAADLFTPRGCERGELRVMTLDQVNAGLKVLLLRERVIYRLAVVEGMRPGEILALKRGSIVGITAHICQRIYNGDVDTPKSDKSVRTAALSEGTLRDLQAWLEESPDTGQEGWLFPSQNIK